MPVLIEPTTALHASWLAAHDEWGPGLHEDGFGLTASDDVRSPAGFRAWVTRLTSGSAPASAGATSPTYRWVVEGEEVLGGIALRTGPRDLVLRMGHIGFGIRPSARRRGVAAWALGQMLTEAVSQGLDRVLLVCEVGNTASAATIEALGGVREEPPHADVGTHRYWVAPLRTSPARPASRLHRADRRGARRAVAPGPAQRRPGVPDARAGTATEVRRRGPV